MVTIRWHDLFMHRLDRPVSGIMVFAKTSKAASSLSDQVRKKEIKKTYMAVVKGIIKKDEDTFVDYLLKLDNGNTIVTTKDKGKESVLTYKVLKRNYEKNETLVSIDLKTGRHHQDRKSTRLNSSHPLSSRMPSSA